MTLSRMLAAAAALISVGIVSACGAGDTRAIIHADGASILPSDSLQDWATYGDAVVEWTPTGELRVDPTSEEVKNGEGTITRLVTVKTTQTLWTRPSAPKTLKSPTSLTIANGGWTFHGEEEKPFVLESQPRLEIGQRYLAILSYADKTARASSTPKGPQWIALAYFALTSGVVTAPTTEQDKATEATKEATAATKVVAGKTLAGVKMLVAATPVDPLAKPYLGIDPVLRFQKVSDARIAASSYTPGPAPGER